MDHVGFAMLNCERIRRFQKMPLFPMGWIAGRNKWKVLDKQQQRQKENEKEKASLKNRNKESGMIDIYRVVNHFVNMPIRQIFLILT